MQLRDFLICTCHYVSSGMHACVDVDDRGDFGFQMLLLIWKVGLPCSNSDQKSVSSPCPSFSSLCFFGNQARSL